MDTTDWLRQIEREAWARRIRELRRELREERGELQQERSLSMPQTDSSKRLLSKT